MEFTVTDQLAVFAFAAILGLFLGIINDIFRFIRFCGFSSKLSIFVQDIVFMAVCAVLSFLFAVAYNQGEIRFFTLCGELLGLLVYRYSIGILTGKIFSIIVKVFRKTVSVIKKIIKLIIRLIIKIFRPIFGKNSPFGKFLMKKKKNPCNYGSNRCIIKKSVQFLFMFFVRGKSYGSKRDKNRKTET